MAWPFMREASEESLSIYLEIPTEKRQNGMLFFKPFNHEMQRRRKSLRHT